jgi:terminase small subunit-like protein
MAGRPSLYTAEIAERVLDELAGGRTLRDVCRDDGMPPHNTVRGWVVGDREGFAARYTRARETGYQLMVDEILAIADDNSRDLVDRQAIHRDRIRCRTRQWLLAKALPKLYGDRPDPNAGHQVTDTVAEVLRQIDDWKRSLPGAELRPPENEAG